MIKIQLDILPFKFLGKFFLSAFFLLSVSVISYGISLPAEASEFQENASVTIFENQGDFLIDDSDVEQTFTLTKSKSKPVLKRLLKKRPVINPSPTDVPSVEADHFPLSVEDKLKTAEIDYSYNLKKSSSSPRAP